MLEAMRQNSRSAIIYILFGVLIAAFIISFGPGGMGGGNAERGGHYTARVGGDEVAEHEFTVAYLAWGLGGAPPQYVRQARQRELIMDSLIEREIFAQEAERMGLAASEREVAEMVTSGKLIFAGRLIDLSDPRRSEHFAMRNGKFDYDRFRQVAENHYRVTLKRLMEIQQRELLAFKLREVMKTSTKVSPDEVRARFDGESRQVNLEYVRFAPRRYEEETNLTDADVENWARAHEDAIKKAYEDRKFMYQKQERAAHLRHVLIPLTKDAPEAKVKEAQAKLEAAQKTLQSGTKFSDVARTVSEDGPSKLRGGDMGWKRKGFTGLGDEADKQVFAAKDGAVIGPLRTEQGLELIRVEGFREGDITLGQARAELAEELARDEKMKEKARAAAQEAADKVKAGGKLAELYPKADSDADEAKPKAGKGAAISIEETGLFSQRGDLVQGMGPSPELSKQVFGKLPVGQTLGPLEVGGTFIVATLKERKEPDPAEWDKRKPELMESHQKVKAFEVATAWARQRCTELKTKSKVQVNTDLLIYEGAGKDPLAIIQPKYEPCAGQLGLF